MISMDYAFMGQEGQEGLTKILVVKDRKMKNIFSHPVRPKVQPERLGSQTESAKTFGDWATTKSSSNVIKSPVLSTFKTK